MPRKAVTADTDTDELQDVVKARLATDIMNPADVIGAAAATVMNGGVTVNDGIIAGRINDPASETSAALDTKLASFSTLTEDPADPGTFLIGGA